MAAESWSRAELSMRRHRANVVSEGRHATCAHGSERDFRPELLALAQRELHTTCGVGHRPRRLAAGGKRGRTRPPGDLASRNFGWAARKEKDESGEHLRDQELAGECLVVSAGSTASPQA